jgi:hypothetical protein
MKEFIIECVSILMNMPVGASMIAGQIWLLFMVVRPAPRVKVKRMRSFRVLNQT